MVPKLDLTKVKPYEETKKKDSQVKSNSKQL